ncbi:C40 family peptidase [bacterium]|nr:C40 family peptidase [bacterium]
MNAMPYMQTATPLTFPQLNFSPTFGAAQMQNAFVSPLAFDPMSAQMFSLNQQFMLGMSQMINQWFAMAQSLNLNPGSLGLPGAPAGTSASAGPVPTSQSSVAAPAGPSDGSIPPKVQKLIDMAESKQGAPYVFGAAGPSKFDCSGLVSWALKQAGSSVARMSADGLKSHYAKSAVSKDELKPGDLVFFYSPNDRGIKPGHATHVEIYLGNGMTMGTDNPKEGARIEPINWKTFIGGARPPELQA